MLTASVGLAQARPNYLCSTVLAASLVSRAGHTYKELRMVTLDRFSCASAGILALQATLLSNNWLTMSAKNWNDVAVGGTVERSSLSCLLVAKQAGRRHNQSMHVALVSLLRSIANCTALTTHDTRSASSVILTSCVNTPQVRGKCVHAM